MRHTSTTTSWSGRSAGGAWAWLTPLLGVAAGALAVGLLSRLSPLLALGALAAIPVAAAVAVQPHLGLYLLIGAMIAQWPGSALRYGGILMAGLALLWALARRRQLVPPDRLLAAFLPLLGFVWLSALQVADAEALRIALAYAGFALLYWTMSTLADSPAVVRRTLAAMLISGAIVGAVAVVQTRYPFLWFRSASALAPDELYLGASPQDIQTVNGQFRADSLTGAPDFLGMSMQILLPFAVMWGVRRRSNAGRAAAIALVLLLIGGMVASLTRGVMLTTALIVVPLLAAKIGWRRSLPYLALAGALALGGVLVWAPARDRLVSTVEEWTNPDARTAVGWRRDALPVATQLFLDNFWTGVGLGRHREIWHQYAPHDLRTLLPELQDHIHNAYLATGIELGVGGLAALLLLQVAAWRRSRNLQRRFRAAGSPDMLAYAQAAEVAWVGLAVNIFLYPQLDLFRYFWVLLALIGAMSRVAADQAGQRSRR